VSASPKPPVPMTPAVFHILLALSSGERHGYAIMQDVSAQTDGKLAIGPGTLYGTLKRLLAGGLVTEAAERPDPSLDDERRRYYQLSELGRQILVEEAKRLSSLVNHIAMKRLLSGAPPETVAGGVC
jgi:DNA-binding PadR family transcriptional regulator